MTKNMLGFEPMRSLIYVDCAKEDYRVKLENWLYKYHIPDSISQFGPYVSKYEMCIRDRLWTLPGRR